MDQKLLMETLAIQAGYAPGNGEPRQMPIVQSTTFKYATSEDMGKLFDLEASGYLNKILALLKQGKPVLFGAKNAYGGQHWVVITGFTGGAVSAANFTVNDPGSNSRTTLQQFLNVYPTFYKYFHY